MGSMIELNDTLQITTEQGFPSLILDLERHAKEPIRLGDIPDKVFEFRDKPGARIFHVPPTRCFLVHNIGGKWVYWGKILVIEQTIHGGNSEEITTSGRFRITEIYEHEYQRQITLNESPEGKSFF